MNACAIYLYYVSSRLIYQFARLNNLHFFIEKSRFILPILLVFKYLITISRDSKLISTHIFYKYISDILQVLSKTSGMLSSMKVNSREFDYTYVFWYVSVLFRFAILWFYFGFLRSVFTILAYTGCTQITTAPNGLWNRLDRVGTDVFWKHFSACNLGAVALTSPETDLSSA